MKAVLEVGIKPAESMLFINRSALYLPYSCVYEPKDKPLLGLTYFDSIKVELVDKPGFVVDSHSSRP